MKRSRLNIFQQQTCLWLYYGVIFNFFPGHTRKVISSEIYFILYIFTFSLTTFDSELYTSKYTLTMSVQDMIIANALS